MSSVDERVVEMRFRNGQFEKGIADTSRSLAKFKNDLDLKGAGKGLEGIGKAASNLKIDGIGDTVEKINSKFSLLGVVGATAVGKITASAMNMGQKLVSNVLDPIIQGGERRSQNISQAKFMLEGLKVAWDDIKPSIDYAVNGTAYGLDEAARAASSLVASNVPLEDMGDALRGISGVAAMTGGEYSDIAQIFTTVAGNGRLMASELNRIGQRGLNAAAALAEYMTKQTGVMHNEADIRKLTSEGKINFETFSKAMNSAFGDQATKANDLYSGSLANLRAALARVGEPLADGKFERLRLIFNALAPQIDAVKNAFMPLLNLFKDNAIAQGGFIANLIGAVDLTWLEKFMTHTVNGIKNIQTIFKNFGTTVARAWDTAFSQSTLFSITGLLTAMAGAFEAITAAMIPSNGAFNALGNVLTVVFGAISVLVRAVKGVLDILNAFRGLVFEVVVTLVRLIAPFFRVGRSVEDSSMAIGQFFEMLRNGIGGAVDPVVNGLNKLRDMLKKFGDNAVVALEPAVEWFGRGVRAVQDFISENMVMEKLFGIVMGLGELFIALTDKVVTFVKESEPLQEFFKNFMEIVEPIGKFIAGTFLAAIDGLNKMFSDTRGIDGWTARLDNLRVALINFPAAAINGIVDFFSNFSLNIDMKKIFGGIGNAFAALGDVLGPIGQGIGSALGVVGDAIGAFFSKFDLKSIDLLATLAAKLLLTWQALKTLRSAKDMMDGIGGFFTNFFDNLVALKTAESGTTKFLKIAGGIAILAASLWLLSGIPADKLWTAVGVLAAIGAAVTALVGVLNMLGKNLSPEQANGVAAIGKVLMSLAISIGILAASVWVLSKIPFDQLISGLGTLVLLLGGLTIAALALIKMGAGKGLLQVGGALFALSGSLLLLALSIKIFSAMDWDTILDGMLKLAMAIAPLALSVALISRFSKGSTLAAGAILALTGSLLGIIFAIKQIASMDSEDLTKGLLIVTGALAAMVGSLILLSRFAGASMVTAGSMVVLAGSIFIISEAIKNLATAEGDIQGAATSLLMLSAGLGVIAAAMGSMGKGALLGAGAFLILAGGLIAIAYALQMVAEVPMSAILGLSLVVVVLAGAFGLLAIVAQRFAVGAAIVIGAILAIALVGFTMSLFVRALEGMIDALSNFVEVAITAFERLGPALTNVGSGLEDLGAALQTLTWDDIGKIGALTLSAMGLSMAALPISMAAMMIGGAFKLIGDSMQSFATYGAEAAENIPKIIESITSLTDGAFDTAAFAFKLGVLSGALLPFGAALITLGEGIAIANRIGGKVESGSIEKISDAIEDIMDVLNAAFDGAADYSGASSDMKGIGQGLEVLSDGIDKANSIGANIDDTQVENIAIAIDNIMEVINKAFGDADVEVDGKNVSAVGEGLKSISEAMDLANAVGDKIEMDQIGVISDAVTELMSVLRDSFTTITGDGDLTQASGEAMQAVGKGLDLIADAFVKVNEVAAQVNLGSIMVLSIGMSTLFNTLHDNFSSNFFTSGSKMTAASGEAMDAVAPALGKLADAFAKVNEVAAVVDEGNIQELSSGMGALFEMLRANFSSNWWMNSGSKLTGESAENMSAISPALTKLNDAFMKVNETAGNVEPENITKLSNGMGELFSMLAENFSNNFLSSGLSEKSAAGMTKVSPALGKLNDAFLKVNETAESVDVGNIMKLSIGMDLLFSTLNDSFKGGFFSSGLSEKSAESMSSVSSALRSVGGAMRTISSVADAMDAGAIFTFTAGLRQITNSLTGDNFKDLDAEAIGQTLYVVASGMTRLGGAMIGFAGADTGIFTQIASGITVFSRAVSTDLASNVSQGVSQLSMAFMQLRLQLMITSTNLMVMGAMMMAGASIVMIAMTMIRLSISTALSSIQSTMPTAGAQIVLAFAAGMLAGTGRVRAATVLIGNVLLLTIRSYHPRVRSMGQQATMFFAAGVSASQGRVSSAGRSVGTTFVSALRAGLAGAASVGRSGGFSVGVAIADGATAGVNSGSYGLVSAVQAMAARAVNAAKRELDINSPSRVFEWIGEMMAAGGGVGIDRNSDQMVSASENMGNQAIQAIRGSLSGLQDELDLDPDFSPTIRPILDLSELESKSSRIGRLMSASPLNASVSSGMAQGQAASMTQRKLAEQSAVGGGKGDLVYNQYITSPKAISKPEVYRHTNNLLARAKKGR